ncbi:MAG: signal peptide peptidase SppA, partial [Muribaculaceae bacterium]|nr:signal peptide peptidase SppA [Muribaculaceae bacterium]
AISRPQTLENLVMAIREAKANNNISAIYLKCGGVSAGLATLNALREEIKAFRESGKPVIAYGDYYSSGDYFVATAANHLYMNPAGQIALQGIGGTSLYLKGLFDKIGVTFQVVKVGTYKSAVEPYILTEMSQPARAQLDTLYSNMWRYIRETISDGRADKVSAAAIDTLVSRDFIFLKSGKEVEKTGLVDKLLYERKMDEQIASILGKDVKKLNFVEPSVLVDPAELASALSSKRQIAVVYASGQIVDGGGAATINFEKFVPLITRLADDDNVKGMVLRVNSPGGAVFGSEQIGEALDYFQSKKKPLAVSMGDYAASGGYWISCCANRIFADELTITGSIGIFGLIPNVAGLMDKLGVSPQEVATNPEAEFPNGFKPMDERQLAAMQKYVEKGYDKFVARVAKGRKMKEEKVRSIGEGRVWDAGNAVRLGLVDEIGNLQKSVEWVAEKCGLGENYSLASYPKIENSFWNMLPEMADMNADGAVAKAVEGNYDLILVKYARKVLSRKPVQALMPEFDVRFIEARPL